VATVLRDAGYRLERIRLAQQASEHIIQTFVSERHIRRFNDASLGRFLRAVRADGEGMYIVGLDSHVGLLVCEPRGEFFIHSSGLRPWCVVKEPAAKSAALLASRYRVYGKLTDDENATRKWLLGQAFATRTR
jgi:hypothetical protein